MGQEIQQFSEEVANRIDRIVKKKAFDLWGDPWTIQGIPLIFPSTDNGFNVGLRVAVQDIRRQDPHKFELEGQVLTSDVGRYKHMLRVDYPHAIDGKFRITSRVAYDRDISFRYFGIGNEVTIDKSRDRFEDPLYQNTRSSPSFNFQILRNIGRYLRLGPLLGLRWTTIYAPPGSLLLQDQPVGIAGGRTHHLGIALVHDTTDFEPYPSRGRANELYMLWYAPFLGSDYNFFRFTYVFREYIPLHRDLILAYRGMLESLTGSVPFYELGAVGGVNPTIGFGGDRYLRGYRANHYIDRLRLVLGVELRWDPISFIFAKQELTIGFVPFFDIGRVWPSFLPLRLGHWRASTGWGTRLIWNNRFIIRGDLAMTNDGMAYYIELGNSF